MINFLSSCTTPNKTYLVSGIDSQYRLRITQQGSKNAASSSVSFYQGIFSQTLASDCVYSPSDSAYSQIVSKKCGSLISLVKTYDRFLRESDVAFLGSAMIATQKEYKFLDVPEDCEFF